MASLREDFQRSWEQTGFGFAQGEKWKQHTGVDLWEQESEYLTKAQIRKKEAGNRKSTAKKIATAKALGRGKNIPGQYMGYYYDESRGEYVYLYSSNMKHIGRDIKEKGLKTTQQTGKAYLLSALVECVWAK